MPNKKPSEQSKTFLHRMFSGYNLRPIDFEFNEDNLGGFMVIYKDGRRMPGYIFNIFRGNYQKHQDYIETFK